MKRYVMFLATGSVVGLQALPVYVSAVSAQEKLDTVYISGPANKDRSGIGYPGYPDNSGIFRGGIPQSGADGNLLIAGLCRRVHAPDAEAKSKCNVDYEINASRTTAIFSARLQDCNNISVPPWYPASVRTAQRQSCEDKAVKQKDLDAAADNAKRDQCLMEASGCIKIGS